MNGLSSHQGWERSSHRRALRQRFAAPLAALSLAAALFATACRAADGSKDLVYDVGGPLEGPKLQLFPTQHGEAPGYPGCVPALAAEKAQGKTWDAQGMAVQQQLYPGSVENWRAYWFKYVPVRSLYDAGSLLKVWTADKLPGVNAGALEQYAAPLYWTPRHDAPIATGLLNKPVPVMRWKLGSPEIKLDCGELGVGVYVVRVIGAVETKELAELRKPLYITMTVNDGPKGEVNEYRLRAGYVDEFYSVVELYFHAPAKRAYTASLKIDQGSTVPLLVQSVDLHDALAGMSRRAVKTRTTLISAEERTNLRKQKAGDAPKTIANMDARRALDAKIWSALPPTNTQFGGNYGQQRGYHTTVQLGANGKTLDEIDKEYGGWGFAPEGPLTNVLLVNEKLKLQYTTEDLAQHKPLPDPYPIKDSGTGYVTPANGDKPQQEFAPIGGAAVYRFDRFLIEAKKNASIYNETGNAEAGWTAAVQLARFAYQYPTLDPSNHLNTVVSNPGAYGRDLRSRRRDATSGTLARPDGCVPSDLLRWYDMVYDVIPGNQALADSIGRFVPWVKTPNDVIELFDVYLVQNQARQVLRYQQLYDNDPTWIAVPAAVLGDNKVTEPWMNWLFAKAYVYPNRPIGIADVMITGNDRGGIGYIGSWTYGLGEQAMNAGNLLNEYLQSGGLKKFDLSDPQKYPKVYDAARYALDSRLGGLGFPRIGDVAGPDKPPAYQFDTIFKNAPIAWEWTHEPRFAYILKHYVGRKEQNDAQWAEIEKAAATVKRAPWLDLRSRLLPNWFAALETGLEHDDYRFRSSAMVRMGLGYGHAHADTLDLQITSAGLPATVDAGQRPGYGKPGDARTRVHNLVEIDGKNWIGHAWARTLTDAPGAPYLRAEATPPKSHPNVSLHQRQVALIDGDAGTGSRALKPEEMRPTAKLDANVTPSTSYVFDVVRVSGGTTHTYCFHGPLEDELTTNVATKPYEALSPEDQTAVAGAPTDVTPNYPIKPQRWGGAAPAVMQATWRMADKGVDGAVPESAMSPNYIEGSPRKYTRLHVLGNEGASVLASWYWCSQWKYGFNNVYTVRRGSELESVFPAIIEPYAGKPFIKAEKMLNVEANENDAQRAVAVEVQLESGRTDLLFADGRPENTRTIEGGTKVAGEFGFISRDAKGLRQATLTGGTTLELKEISIRPFAAERTATVTAVDFNDRSMTIKRGAAAWPDGQRLAGRTFEIGVPGRMTAYTIKDVTGTGESVKLAVTQGAHFYASVVRSSDPSTKKVVCALALPMQDGAAVPGIDKHLVASNGDGTKFWRATYLGRVDDSGIAAFELEEPFTEKEFAEGSELRLWEYGVGDTLRQSTTCSLRRVEDGVYEWTADVDAIVTFRARPNATETSVDGKTWKSFPGKTSGPTSSLHIPVQMLNADGKLFIRVK